MMAYLHYRQETALSAIVSPLFSARKGEFYVTKTERRNLSSFSETDGPGAPVISAAPEDSKNPDWLTKTPEVTYDLMMFDATGDEIQDIDLSRAEFIALKAELGRMRGIAGARKDGKATL